MPFHDSQVFELIDRISDHYTQNINNRFLRTSFIKLIISREDWERIDELIGQSQYEKTQGYRFWELYQRILALAAFTYKARNELAPNIRSLLGSGTGFPGRSTGNNDDIFREMAISNFGANLDVLSDMLHELYIRTIAVDKDSHKLKSPVYTRMPELKNMGNFLVRR